MSYSGNLYQYHLSKHEIPNEVFKQLSSVKDGLFGLFIHDSKNELEPLALDLEMLIYISGIKNEAGLKSNNLNTSKFKDAFNTRTIRMENALERFSKLYTKYQEYYFENNFDSPLSSFISKPYLIYEDMLKMYPDIDITLNKKSNKTLEIFYPRSILFGIFREFINNAVKHNEEKVRITLKWSIVNCRFILEVQDNGKGITPVNEKGGFPIEIIRGHLKVNELGGLKIVERLIKASKGKLLYSKSKQLGGTTFHCSFPVHSYCVKGYCHACKQIG